MSDSPIVFKRTKSKPSQRSRSIASELQDETQPSSAEVTGTDEESHSTIAAKIKKQRKKPKSALSFGGNDEVGIRLLSKNVY
jgi:GC-rich sequence DNA-binding factor